MFDWHSWRAFGMIGWLVLAAGCGSGEYQKRLEKSVTALQAGSVFEGLGPAQAVPDVPISLRMPPQFVTARDKAANPAGAKLQAPDPLAPAWGPASYYAFPQKQAQDVPVYQVFFGAMKIQGAQQPLGNLLMEFREKFADNSASWQAAPMGTPRGGSMSYQKLRVEKPLDFVMAGADGSLKPPKAMPGFVEIYGREQDGWALWMIVRSPTKYESEVDWPKLTQQMAGSMEFQNPSPPQ